MNAASQFDSALNPERHFLLEHIGFRKTIVRAAGNYYYDGEGTAYLDCLAQYGAVPFGHNPPRLWECIRRMEAQSAPALVQPLVSPAAEELGARLIALAPGAMRYVTFVNSGAEATESAIKLARANTGRQVILSAVRGYHGKTLGALSATDNPAYRTPFNVDTSAFERVPFNDLDALAARLKSGDVAAFIVEAVQGEGGMRVAQPGYLARAAELCREHGTLFVLDEVQTGLGRTGKLFAAEHEAGLQPDIILLAKALGGGLVPLGAVLCAARAWTEDFGFFHSSTFANNNFTCEIGCAVLTLLTEQDGALVTRAAQAGDRLQRGLDALVETFPRAYAGRTGRGLMQGLMLAPWAGDLSYFLSLASAKGYSVPLLAGYLLNRHQILTAPVINQSATLRIEPPLTVTDDEIDRLLAALAQAGALMEAEDFPALLAYIPHPDRAEDTAPGSAMRTARSQPIVAPDAPVRAGKFAFLIHPTDENVLLATMPPAFDRLDEATKTIWKKWMGSWSSRMYEPAPVYHLPALRSRTGACIEGWLIAAPLTPAQMMRLKRPEKQALMSAYLSAAEELGADITGLGAFTSIITRGGAEVPETTMPLTSGNSLTAISSAESLIATMRSRGRNLATQTVAVVGAAGSIGRLASMHLARHVGRVTLVGNPGNPGAKEKLAAVAGEAYRLCARAALKGEDAGVAAVLRTVLGRPTLVKLLDSPRADDPLAFHAWVESMLIEAGVVPPLIITTGHEEALSRADAALCATNVGASFIDPALFRSGAIVCDVARPLDVLGNLRRARDDLFAYEGGILSLPENISFGEQNVLGYPSGYNLACLSETLVLAFEGGGRSYSIGTALDYDEAQWIYERACAHGFHFAVLGEDGEDQQARAHATPANLGAACSALAG